MTVLADPFATSTAGYISGIIVPSMLALFGAVILYRMQKKDAGDQEFRRQLREDLQVHSDALNENSRALAVLVQRADDHAATLTKVPGLQAAVDVLRERVDQHEKWSNESRRELIEQIRQQRL